MFDINVRFVRSLIEINIELSVSIDNYNDFFGNNIDFFSINSSIFQ